MGVAKVKWNTARSANRSYRVQHQGRTRPFSIEPRVGGERSEKLGNERNIEGGEIKRRRGKFGSGASIRILLH